MKPYRNSLGMLATIVVGMGGLALPAVADGAPAARAKILYAWTGVDEDEVSVHIVPAHLLTTEAPEGTAEWLVRLGAEVRALAANRKALRERGLLRTDFHCNLLPEARPQCNFFLPAAAEPPPKITAADRVVSAPLVVIGIVEAQVPGWDVLESQAATIAYLKIEEVWRGHGEVSVGDVVTIRQSWGGFEIEGTTLCTSLYPRLPWSETEGAESLVGARYLLAAATDRHNEAHLDALPSDQFRLVDGQVFYSGQYDLYDPRSITLEEVRTSFCQSKEADPSTCSRSGL